MVDDSYSIKLDDQTFSNTKYNHYLHNKDLSVPKKFRKKKGRHAAPFHTKVLTYGRESPILKVSLTVENHQILNFYSIQIIQHS